MKLKRMQWAIGERKKGEVTYRLSLESNRSCTFPSDEHIRELGGQLLDTTEGESRFLGVTTRRDNYLLLRVRSGIPKKAMDAFVNRIGDRTTSP